MASWKADPRYTDRCDDVHSSSDYNADSVSSVDEHELEEFTNADVRRLYLQWLDTHYDEIEEVYCRFLDEGRAWFGSAFHQLGSITTFAMYVFEQTTPGAR